MDVNIFATGILNASANIPVKYKKKEGEMEIGDNLIYCLGFNDEGSVDRIAGMTVAGS